MSTKESSNHENPEIDLLSMVKKINEFFEWIKTSLFLGIRFFVKNSIVISILFVCGVAIGLYLDQTRKTYNQRIIVAPNFESTDYLYSKIDLIESKIANGDIIFLKSIGIQNPMGITKISIEPIVDVYKLINEKEQNLDLLELMAENGDLKTIVKETTTSKNYAYHTIIVTTNGITDRKKTVDPIVNFLNKSEYYSKFQEIYFKNIQQNIKTKEGIITQIDGILNGFSAGSGKRQLSDKLVYYNENTPLNEVIKTKDSLSQELGKLKLELYNSNKIINDQAVVLNIINDESIKNRLKFILPGIFIGLFIFINFFLAFYKKQSLKAQQN